MTNIMEITHTLDKKAGKVIVREINGWNEEIFWLVKDAKKWLDDSGYKYYDNIKFMQKYGSRRN